MAYQTTIDLPIPGKTDVDTLAWALQACTLPWPWKIVGVSVSRTKDKTTLHIDIQSADTAPPTDADLKALEDRVPDAVVEFLAKHKEMYKKFVVAASVCKERITARLAEALTAEEAEKEKKEG